MEIREVDWGIANNYGDYIEINKHLKAEYPDLYDSILKHEMSHTDNKGFTKEDFILDIDTKVSNFRLAGFMVRHPKSFAQLLPFYFRGGNFYYDINMIIFCSAFIGISALMVYLII